MVILQQIKEVLGKTGQVMTDEEIQKLMASMDYLSSEWLDLQERKIFNGMTIDELLNQ